MKQLIISAALLLLPLTAGAATYSWTDARGTMHFTDDIGAVPKQHRARALRQAAGEMASTPAAPAEPATPAAAAPDAKPKEPVAPKGASVTPAAPEGPATVESAVTPATRFGDRTAAEWQTEFRALRQKLTQIEQQQEQLRKDGGDGKTLLTRQKIDEINTRNKQLYEEYEATRLRFNQLVEQANKVGLPPEFGQ